MRKIVFVDVDGTLVLDDQSVPIKSMEAIQRARANGHYVMLCTGRSKPELFKHILEIGFDGLICAGGGYAEINEKVLFHHTFHAEDVKHLITFFDANEVDYYLESNGGLFASPNCVTHLMQIMGIQDKKEHPFTAVLIEGEDMHRSDINKVCFLQSKLAFEQIKQEFEKTFQVWQCTVPSFGKDSGELGLANVSKKKAIQQVLEALDMNQSQTVAIGDGINDLDMIAFAQVGIAMGNADLQLKEIANDVCADITDDGLYQAFEKYHLI